MLRFLLLAAAVALGVLIGGALVPYARLALAPPPAPVAITPRGDLAMGERATIELFQAAQGSVVFIATQGRAMDMFRRMDTPRGTGSGFVWDGAGHVVTNAHVIAGSSRATVRLPGGRARPARLVGVDRRNDLAVLQVQGMGLAPLPVGTSADLQVGQSVFAIGNPFGLDFTLTTGVVSALGREIPTDRGGTIRGLVQTDAAINPGNSGGPLLDSAGRLIGVNTAIFSPSGASAGIGFAVPVDTVARVVPQLIARGRYDPPALGVVGDPRADAWLARSGRGAGAIVLDVAPGGPAEAAGLEGATETADGIEPRDVIEALDGEAVASIDDVLALLDRHAAGDEVVLTVRRGRARREVPVTLARGG